MQPIHPRFFFALAPVLSVLVLGCSETTRPGSSPQDGGAVFDGQIDPSREAFVLDRIEQRVPGQEPVQIELRGRNLQVIRGGVALEVAVRNADRRTLYAPAMIWVSGLRPESISIRNPDFLRGADPSPGSSGPEYGFDYSAFLGEDGALSPEEVSGYRTWLFEDPELVPFSFAATAQFALEPDMAFLGGTLFQDTNQNGTRDRGEVPFTAAALTIVSPDGSSTLVFPDSSGVYRLGIRTPGLFTVVFESLIDCPICITTPNPLHVAIVPDAAGRPRSYEAADFGAFCGPCKIEHGEEEAVVLTTAPPDSVDQDPYGLVHAEIDAEGFIALRVGFGGCQPEHPFTLFAGRRFEVAETVRTWMILAHDNLGEHCRCGEGSRCWFEKSLRFDPAPIRRAYLEDFGEPGAIDLLLRDYQGGEHRLHLDP